MKKKRDWTTPTFGAQVNYSNLTDIQKALRFSVALFNVVMAFIDLALLSVFVSYSFILVRLWIPDVEHLDTGSLIIGGFIQTITIILIVTFVSAICTTLYIEVNGVSKQNEP